MCTNVKFTACRVFFLLAINPRNAKQKTVSSSPARHFYCITLHFFHRPVSLAVYELRAMWNSEYRYAHPSNNKTSHCTVMCLAVQRVWVDSMFTMATNLLSLCASTPHTAAQLETTTNPSSSFWNIVPVLFAPHRCRLTPRRKFDSKKQKLFTLIPLFRVEPLDLRHKHLLAFSHVFTRYNAFSLCSANTLLLLSCNPEKREMQEQKACKSLLVHRDPRQRKVNATRAWCDEQRTDRRRSQLKIVWNNVSKLIEFWTR